MHYTVEFLPKFAQEFANFPLEHQNKVLDFVRTFQLHGLSDFSIYEGKIAPSWVSGTPEYHFARSNALWHYHIGIPTYVRRHGRYKTSDVVLHFQWKGKGDHISLVDMYDHYTREGRFYLPSGSYLVR
ncbi:MAG: hypothetical protein HLX50_01780 [Alteromonadaceae bacterium]|nr:hypothetical protein [Alteromonadaceae bacterium]